MADKPHRDQLRKLEERIAAAKLAREPKPSRQNKYEASSLAWRMVLELVVGMALGCLIGYGLDVLFGTLPLFLMIFAVLGFAAGIRTMMRSAEEVKRGRKRPGEETE
ncbi:AtpZ/AtpI family protein [Halovulum dunhuangense]|uniref:ATP synthase protein I n=1 Tax=Halovulum dunhuangense TaxID=1505036 RepID=A0A849KYX2_9RHOB|nr:AtpZ/AtpI family protein [Halovulum dunhuangense]NNU79556.1 AtpZ/AtpI family protein [Halovulum dunhuangense]